MAKELSESRKRLITMFQNMDIKQEQLDKQERINKRVDELKKELEEITDRAYTAIIGKKIAEYQERISDTNKTEDEKKAINDERSAFEAAPSKYGIIREKCPIEDETDKNRALQIVELLKDVNQLGEDKELDFLQSIEGFGSRNKKD